MCICFYLSFFFNRWLYSRLVIFFLVLYNCLIIALIVKHNFEKVGLTVYRKMAKSVVEFVHFCSTTERL